MKPNTDPRKFSFQLWLKEYGNHVNINMDNHQKEELIWKKNVPVGGLSR